jgi:chromosome segregation ATPase
MGSKRRSLPIIRGWVLAAVTVAVMLGATTACGSSQSASDKAKSQVCDAKSNIQTQIDSLKSLTLSATSLQDITTSANAIKNDLKTIQAAIPKLSGDTKSQVQAANAAFESEVSSTFSSLLSTSSLSQAQTQFQSALTKLESSYASAFDQVKC